MRKNYLLLFTAFLFTSCSEELIVADFGDGEISTLKTHTYNKAGNYSVKLNASNDDGKNNVT